MTTRAEAVASLIKALGWEPESDTTAGLVRQLSRMLEVSDGGLSVKEPPTYVARVGKRGFESLADALAKGGNVRLVADVEGSYTVPKGVRATIDLNGHSITTSGVAIINKGRLTVRGSGTIKSTGDSAIAVGSDSVTVIDGGTIESVEGAIITGRSKNAKVTVNGGTLRASDNAVLASNGTEGCTGNTWVVTGGTFLGGIKSSGYVACGIYAPNDNFVTVSGGSFEISGGCGVCARAGRTEVSGGLFHTSGESTGKVGDSRVVVPCAALVFDTEANYPGLTDGAGIFVTGGTFRSDVNPVAYVGEPRITISGGKFSDEVPEACLAKGFSNKETEDGYEVRQ